MSDLDLSSDYKIEYIDSNGDLSKRKISPIREFDYDDNSYVEAYCHKRKENRTFKTNRIKSKKKLGRKSVDRNPSYSEENWPFGVGTTVANTNYKAPPGNHKAKSNIKSLGYIIDGDNFHEINKQDRNTSENKNWFIKPLIIIFILFFLIRGC